ncbi:sensor domain-containing protein [Aquibacillus rhizosphaerae]|uniref:EAL domain-containing protein n=1 Tax=Aquibacillus rhizosphaerae TaxID=3051431 RepID=A0ABT7L9B2_9BACI|nr:EAL domain-containing protein [Aquibacillus sp. LR5S19]MDL4841822.1 EAL domain-containing protein [Aquibacillus sp. LR5S19]
MTLFNLENIFDQNKLDHLFFQLKQTDKNEGMDQAFANLKTYLDEQFKIYKDLNYAVSQSTTITVSDLNGAITYVDDHFCELTGFSKDELLNRNHSVLNSGYHDQQFFENIWNTILSGKVWNGEVKNKRKDGVLIWLQTTIVPILNNEGAPFSFIAFRTDITEKKLMEIQLVEALQNDYHRVLKELMNLVFRVKKTSDDGYIFTMVEGKLAEKIGLTTDYLLDQPIKSLYAKERLDMVYQGEEVTFNFKTADLYLYVMLSPIMENGTVVEVIGSAVDITSLKQAEEQVEYLSHNDPLTNLANRTKFREDIEKLTETSTRNNPFSILLCDLDRLKYINDSLGEFAGDKVIKVIAERLQRVIHDKGSLYRYGGDEFIAIIKGSYQEVDELSDKMINAIKKPISVAGKEFFITSSIGISNFYQDGILTDELINHASIAVHYGKVNGRNSKLFYTPKMNKMYNSLLLLEGEVNRALNKNEFVLHYQPKINVITGDIIGFEALIRWFHKEKGYIPPSEFIPLAEETGLIIQLGEWVITEACRQHVRWVEKGLKPFNIAVNVSAIELQRSDFAEKVKTIVYETGMNPEYLEIEITENSVMQNTEDCIRTMNQLRLMGISLSIDDFGTGYSSLGYLRKFPINHLKIDQSFIKNSLIESSNAEIIKAMIQIAHTFGLKVVAEGVEEPHILKFIEEQSCDYYQGYYFSKPVPPDEIEALIVSDSEIRKL